VPNPGCKPKIDINCKLDWKVLIQEHVKSRSQHKGAEYSKTPEHQYQKNAKFQE